MDHVAIMNPRWKLIDKILRGEKTVESRWYATRKAPWDCIAARDNVYFKDAGKPVTAKAVVGHVLQYKLTPAKVLEILYQYGAAIAVSDIDESYERYREKRYCILVFLERPSFVEQFDIDKRGYGISNAWLTLTNVAAIRR